jgi:two-component system sensor histidine kinase AlgZ
MTSTSPVGLPLRFSLLAALPIALCMSLMALSERMAVPQLGGGYGVWFRAFYAACYLGWIVPIGLLQRFMWRQGFGKCISVLILLAATYLPALLNSALAQAAAVHWHLFPDYQFRRIFVELDGCWLALVAYCAIHELLHHYDALQQSRRREAEATALAREAELRALQYQLHPHFLFNTLNSISALVADGRGSDATRMIARLGDLLRATLERSDRREVTLADELSLTEHYIDIEKARLGSRLQVELRVGPGILQALVPPLLLQPLVENAIRHGIAMRATGGAMNLSIEGEQGVLRVDLRNDGAVSMDASLQRPGAIGLNNVSQRLQALYPNTHTLDVIFAPTGGCTVQLTLPLRIATAVALTEVSSA